MLLSDCGFAFEDFVQLVGETVRIRQCLFGRDLGFFRQQLRIAFPAHFHAAIEIRFRARHLEQALRLEADLLAKYLYIRLEADRCAAPVRCCA